MKDLSKGTVSIKGFEFSVTTTRPAVNHYGNPPKDYVPETKTETRVIKLEEHKVDFENNLDMAPEEVQSTNKIVSDMLNSLINASMQVVLSMNKDKLDSRIHELDKMRLEDELDAAKHARIQEHARKMAGMELAGAPDASMLFRENSKTGVNVTPSPVRPR